MRVLTMIGLLLMTLAEVGCTQLSKNMTSNFSQRTEATVQTSRARVTDPEVATYFQELGQEVLASARRLAGADQEGFQRDEALDIYDQFNVYVVHDTMPNAFTSGDNVACFHAPMILMAQSPEEIVMIMGHEFGHMRAGHVVKKMTGLQLGIVAGVAAGAIANSQTSGTTEQKAAAAEQASVAALGIFTAPNPPDEHESDAIGVEIMADMGLDLQYADDAFVTLKAKFGDGGGGTHPSNSDRINRIGQQVAALQAAGYKPTRALDKDRFLRVRERLRGIVKHGVETDSIVFFSEEQAARGSAFVKPMGCGPLYASPDVVSRVFLETLDKTP